MESLITTLVPFLKVLFAFILMLFGMRMKIGLGLSILIGGIVMGFLFGLGPVPIVKTGLVALTQEKFLFLLAIVGLILVLSDGMERSGQSRRLMGALSGFLKSPRLRLLFFPALIGLLPMPGGAIFSAPMVKTVSENMRITNSDRAVINYWFRHVWELVWPLYPAIILTLGLADIRIVDLLSCTWPGTPVMLLAGWWFFLRPGVLDTSELVVEVVPEVGNKSVALREGMPLLIAIVGAVSLESLIDVFFPAIPFEFGVIAALVAAVLCVMVQNADLGPGFLKEVVKKKSLWSIIFVIMAIFVFKDIMNEAGVVTEMARVAGGEAALFASAMFLPFLVGMVSGLSMAYVGASFPLLLGVLQSLGMQDQMMPYLTLGIFSGLTGVMASPIHICFVLTCEYFQCDIGRTWKKVIGPSIVFFLSGIVLFYLLK
ncbi:DUF401 family protein [Pseudodesulfovibrio sp. JC047]|uniref:DUF401 family protein n=1 Tax=Pseudodesulfovibrio sp. JC047 TaxID=2683199 RepID=UPI0013D2E9AE|nr:DUF401 family protein [Pseudodesulfovibrio sp. JC047]NDV19600.1 DUF401 family protein [Pseudodesulfovibrio sp. JC047]